MADESTDVLMTLIAKSGSGLAAECASEWNSDDKMATDFKLGAFFEVEDFSLGGGLELKDASDKTNSSTGRNGSDLGNTLTDRDDPRKEGKEDGKVRDGGKSKAASGGRGTKFEAYIHMKDAQWAQKLKLDVPEISVSRQMDKCSPELFYSCMMMSPLKKAIIVKRKIIGRLAAEGVSVPMMGFLRLEFNEPLITSIDWEDGDVIKEKFKFVCRGFTFTYRPQMPDGSLGEQISRTWDPKTPPQTGGAPSSSNSSPPSNSSPALV